MTPVTTAAAPATMEDVAALAGVSTSTVSRALRDSPLISSRTRERVRQAAAQLDFALSRTASALATGRLGRIGLLVSGPLNTWFNSSVLDAAYATLREAGQELVIYRTKNAADRAHFFAHPAGPAQRRRPDRGVLHPHAPSEYARLAELSVPVVYLNQRVEGSASVFIDDVGGGRHRGPAPDQPRPPPDRATSPPATPRASPSARPAGSTGSRQAVEQHNRGVRLRSRRHARRDGRGHRRRPRGRPARCRPAAQRHASCPRR